MGSGSRDDALPLTVQFLEWLDAAPRTHADVVQIWQTACPRLSIWEDALADRLVAYESGTVVLTSAGRALLSGDRDEA
jgi:hypothetical protein